MEFNKEISKYVFKGVPFGSGRSVITTLKNTLNGFDIYNNFAFDSPESFYIVYFDAIARNWAVTMLKPQLLGELKVLTPEEFICELIGNPVPLDWYNNLQIGDIVKIGYCDSDFHSYHFGFNNTLVRKNYGNEYTIDGITELHSLPDRPMLWYNGDPRAYHIKELDHYIPSSVFIPQFIPSTPIEKVILQSLPISDFNFLK